MPIKLNLTSEKILNKVFPSATRGYDSLVVDQFLDEILTDYQRVEKNVLITQEENHNLTETINELKQNNQALEIENARLKKRLEGIKDNDHVTRENIDILKRVYALEKFIYNSGTDPKTIK